MRLVSFQNVWITNVQLQIATTTAIAIDTQTNI